MKKLFYIAFVLLTACKNADNKKETVWNELPEVKSLASYNQTNFSRTLEDSIELDKNTIYAPALLFAWDKVEEALKSPVVINDSNSIDFQKLVSSQSYLNSLLDSEYTAGFEIIDGAIFASAFFNKTLPFEKKLQAIDEPILFNGIKVSAFGMHHYNKELLSIAEILYYKNDDELILKLNPKDTNHQIILAKGIEGYKTLGNAVEQIFEKVEKGKLESMKNDLDWKYEISDKDLFYIPTIKFNISTNYKTLEGQTFYTKDGKFHIINECIQRNGFILNENGAVIESEATIKADSVGLPKEIKHPKKIIFDKPFLIIAKRVDSKNPYLVIKVSNTELLSKR
jgi:hypothetical protein